MPLYVTPGIYKETVFPEPEPELRTGVPAFLGGVRKKTEGSQRLSSWPQFEAQFETAALSYTPYAVRGFFENGGRVCDVLPLETTTPEALQNGLDALAPQDDIDLVCAPDLVLPGTDPEHLEAMQAAILDHCGISGDRFAILDTPFEVTVDQILEQREPWDNPNGALYCPWVRVSDGPEETSRHVPPCGHIAGVYARTDIHKAPANEALEGVLDLETQLARPDQDRLNAKGINCLCAFPGRGIRVWGARTLSQRPEWAYINVRHLFLTTGRWVEHHMADVAFEPNDIRLWTHIERDLTAYFETLFRHGVLKGNTPEEAFFVKCDAETNPPEVRDTGCAVTEIGLAPAVPNEFVVVRITHGTGGASLSEPTQPT